VPASRAPQSSTIQDLPSRGWQTHPRWTPGKFHLLAGGSLQPRRHQRGVQPHHQQSRGELPGGVRWNPPDPSGACHFCVAGPAAAAAVVANLGEAAGHAQRGGDIWELLKERRCLVSRKKKKKKEKRRQGDKERGSTNHLGSSESSDQPHCRVCKRNHREDR